MLKSRAAPILTIDLPATNLREHLAYELIPFSQLNTSTNSPAPIYIYYIDVHAKSLLQSYGYDCAPHNLMLRQSKLYTMSS
jgi:hypothetical protein